MYGNIITECTDVRLRNATTTWHWLKCESTTDKGRATMTWNAWNFYSIISLSCIMVAELIARTRSTRTQKEHYKTREKYEPSRAGEDTIRGGLCGLTPRMLFLLW
eukprot:6485688-Amphidinium_carterae.2